MKMAFYATMLQEYANWNLLIFNFFIIELVFKMFSTNIILGKTIAFIKQIQK